MKFIICLALILGMLSHGCVSVGGVRYYNFPVVGDTNYAAITRRYNVFQLMGNSKRLFIPLRRLAGLTIKIE